MIDLNVRALVELTHRFLAPMREEKWRNHQRCFNGRVSAGAIHGNLRGDESVRALVF